MMHVPTQMDSPPPQLFCRCVESAFCTKKILLALAIISALGGALAIIGGNVGILSSPFGWSATVGGMALFGISSGMIFLILKKTCRRTHDEQPLGIGNPPSEIQNRNPWPPQSQHRQGHPPDELPEIPQSTIDSQSYTYKFDNYSSHNLILIRVNKEHLNQDPQYHLDKLAEVIDLNLSKPNLGFRVNFINIDGEGENGLDEGGLSFHYLNLLFTVVLSKLIPTAMSTSGLFLPSASRVIDLLNCKKLGKIMGYCYPQISNRTVKDRSYQVGAHLDLSLFAAMLQFSAEDLDLPYEWLGFRSKWEVISAYVRTLKETDNQAESQNEDAEIVDLIQAPLNEFNPKLFKLMLKHLVLCSVDIEKESSPLRERRAAFSAAFDQFYREKYHLNQSAIDFHRQGVAHTSYEDLLADEESAALLAEYPDVIADLKQDLFNEKFGPFIRAFHAMANGFKATLITDNFERNHCSAINEKWEEIRTEFIQPGDELTGYRSFQERIQGTLDRQTIANHIVCVGNEEIQKKALWLQEWITDEATSLSEIKKFLIFSTGRACVIESDPLIIKKQVLGFLGTLENYSPLPIAHTCSNELEFSPVPSGNDQKNDFTKENFIDCLLLAIEETRFGIS